MSEIEDRFWAKVNKTETCWLWTAALTPNGYGRLQVRPRHFLAHRFAYELEVGSIPDGLELDHLCRVRNCVNPDHLEPVTRSENVRRGLAPEAVKAAYAAQTHCARGHEFTDENTYRHPVKGHRSCRACKRDNTRRYYARRAAANV